LWLQCWWIMCTILAWYYPLKCDSIAKTLTKLKNLYHMVSFWELQPLAQKLKCNSCNVFVMGHQQLLYFCCNRFLNCVITIYRFYSLLFITRSKMSKQYLSNYRIQGVTSFGWFLAKRWSLYYSSNVKISHWRSCLKGQCSILFVTSNCEYMLVSWSG
jgi:hypothetical protein